jgi:hypothetical protein
LKIDLLALLLVPAAVSGAAAQALETESARLLRAGTWKLATAYEYQRSAEGHEAAVPVGLEYGLRDDLELLVEPVAYTAIRPKVGPRATGVGDIEATLTYRFRQETPGVPALAAAFEVKIPTARDSLIGTRHTDYAGYVIASKRFGLVDVHANLSYTFVGKPAGVPLSNIFGFALAGVYRPNPQLDLFAEVLATTAASPGGESGTVGAVVPEATGQELVGTLGAGRHLGSALLLYLTVSYDNNSAVLLRPGFTLRVP